MATAAVFLPLFASLIALLFARFIGDRGAIIVTVGAVNLAALFSIILFFDIALGGNVRTVALWTWIESGDLSFQWALKLDQLTAVMLVVVNVVSAMVHIYSIGYMAHDSSKARFFAYLSLFTFMMLMLVTADNLVQMFFGWEGVGLASYLLIGFWYHKDSANGAAMKAFIVNRVGDFGFTLGIFATFVLFGSVEFDVILNPDRIAEVVDTQFEFLGYQVHALTCIGLLLFIGAMGKSAQLGLHTWLPDAMEGPTPVSALIHAATMVTAGVFLLTRMSPLLEYAPAALAVVTVVGAATCLVAATIGMTQFDIKRVIAYSTMSQLGYMFFAIGVSAYPAAIFHLMTHAFFKALLFLGAGSVIHAMSDEQDMRQMGGIARHVQYTHVLMWIGSLALAGVGIPAVFGFAGFYSKDIILESAFAANGWEAALAFWLGIIVAFVTAFYSWRLLIMTFYGKPRADEKVMAHIHESPWVMLGPLFPLAFGAVFAGWVGYEYFVGHEMLHFWGDSIYMIGAAEHQSIIDKAHYVPTWVKWLPGVMAVLGILAAYLCYMQRPDLSAMAGRVFAPLHRLFFRKWYFDEVYDAVFNRPAFQIGRSLWKGGDGQIIDGLGPDGVSSVTRNFATWISRLQSGYVYHYAFAMLVGVVALISWYYLGSGG